MFVNYGTEAIGEVYGKKQMMSKQDTDRFELSGHYFVNYIQYEKAEH